MKRFGVLGWPVAHSRSPAMQRAAFRASGLGDHHYQHLPCPPEVFADTVKGLPGVGFAGANVTIPHKERALLLAHDASTEALAIGAANTLTFSDGKILADNTDAPGFINALPHDPKGHGAIVLGAGGSARAVVYALVRAGADPVEVHNRTPERARDLAAELGATHATTTEKGRAILVNCTSVGLDDADATPIADPSRFELVVDLVYRADGDTALVRAAKERGLPTVDGLEILVQQGALSFERWTGTEAPVDAMRKAVRVST